MFLDAYANVSTIIQGAAFIFFQQLFFTLMSYALLDLKMLNDPILLVSFCTLSRCMCLYCVLIRIFMFTPFLLKSLMGLAVCQTDALGKPNEPSAIKRYLPFFYVFFSQFLSFHLYGAAFLSAFTPLVCSVNVTATLFLIN